MRHSISKSAAILLLLSAGVVCIGQTTDTVSSDDPTTTVTAPSPAAELPVPAVSADSPAIQQPRPSLRSAVAEQSTGTVTAETPADLSPAESPANDLPTTQSVESSSAQETTETMATVEPATAAPDYFKITFPTEMNPPVVPQSDVTTTTISDGISYQVLAASSGLEADTTSTRRIHYILWLSDGTYIESSMDREFPTPFSFTPKSGEAIRGMEEGTTGMRVGEIRKLYVPSEQAYGSKGQANIKPNSDLIFVIKLVDVVEPTLTSGTAESPLAQ